MSFSPMPGYFRSACALCGLTSNQLVADHFGISLDTANSWLTGRRRVPDNVWREMAIYYDQLTDIVEHCLDTFERGEISDSGVQAIAEHEHGSKLPAAGVSSVIAAWMMIRMVDDD